MIAFLVTSLVELPAPIVIFCTRRFPHMSLVDLFSLVPNFLKLIRNYLRLETMFILINVTGSRRYCLSDMKWNRVNFWFYLASLISCINFSNGTVEVLKNSDFESSHFNGNWYCAGGCSLTLNSDSYEGSHSVKVSHRSVVYFISVFTLVV